MYAVQRGKKRGKEMTDLAVAVTAPQYDKSEYSNVSDRYIKSLVKEAKQAIEI